MTHRIAALLLVASGAGADEAAPCRVDRVHAGRVTVACPTPVARGDRFVIRRSAQVVIDGAEALALEVVGGFELDRVEPGGAWTGSGRLPRGAFARVGDVALRATGRPRDAIFAPPQWRDMTRLRSTLRPAWAADRGGLVLLGDLAVDHYFRRPLRVGVAIAPVGFVAQEGAWGLSAVVVGQVAYAADYFEVSVGLGADLHTRAGQGFAVPLAVRLGSLDGLHLILEVVARHPGFGSFGGELDLPLGRYVTLSFAGAGSAGWGYGTVGMKSWLRGTGGPGTVILTTSLGVAGVREVDPAFAFGASGVGPTLAVGVEWRR